MVHTTGGEYNRKGPRGAGDERSRKTRKKKREWKRCVETVRNHFPIVEKDDVSHAVDRKKEAMDEGIEDEGCTV